MRIPPLAVKCADLAHFGKVASQATKEPGAIQRLDVKLVVDGMKQQWNVQGRGKQWCSCSAVSLFPIRRPRKFRWLLSFGGLWYMLYQGPL